MDFSLCLSDHSEGENECGEDAQNNGPQTSGAITKADTLRENVGSHVIVLYASTHTRLSKSGTETKVYNINTYATEGFARRFIGEGGRSDRPEAGKKVISLLEVMLKNESASEPQPDICVTNEHSGLLEEDAVEPSFQKVAGDAKMEDVVQQEVEYEVENEFRVHAEDEARNEDENPAIGLQREFQWVAERNPPLAPSTLYTKPPLKRKLEKDEADRLWKKYKESRAYIYWPTFSGNSKKDMWGGKFWECTFGKETQKTVEVLYSGNYEDDSGAKKYEALGQCNVIVSKHSLLKDWTIKLA
ncbi:uncharacterized protein LOC135683590 isoform X2 [Rhopilema esculentum]|uniref:uncharacterized protein LOC135683590 isoform X2 n=1 Tax=Rhopilema esculentum TaxID=499914 RepID=UPI0031DDF50B